MDFNMYQNAMYNPNYHPHFAQQISALPVAPQPHLVQQGYPAAPPPGYPVAYPEMQLPSTGYPVQQVAAPISPMDAAPMAEKNDTKPRLAKHEVDLLESHFQENHKPPSALKRQLADQMCVDVARINNWFQNRRAKAKQEAKALNYNMNNADAAQATETSSDPSSPAPLLSAGSSRNSVEHFGPPAPSSMNPHLAAQLQSLKQSINLAQITYDHAVNYQQSQMTDGMGFEQGMTHDRAQFPSPAPGANSFAFQNYDNGTLAMAIQNPLPLSRPGSSHQHFNDLIPLSAFPNPDTAGIDESSMTFPSQLISESQATTPAFRMAPVHIPSNASSEGLSSPETLGMRFKSPPPPADIASRRNKSRPRPISPEALRDHTNTGPMTVANVATQAQAVTMRRVSSAGAGASVLGGRVQKPSSAAAQRTPLKRTFTTDGDTAKLLEMYEGNSKRQTVSPGRAVAPPTPSSPEDMCRLHSGSSEQHSELSFDGYNKPEQDPAFFMSPIYGPVGLGMNMASPPETPHSFQPAQWAFDVPDEIIQTPGFAVFPGGMPMSHPNYISSSVISAPVTPHLDYFPQPPVALSHSHSSPQFDVQIVDNGSVEYQYQPEPHVAIASLGSSPESMTPSSKSYVFHNSGVTDYAHKSSGESSAE